MNIPWTEVLAAADRVADYLPPPLNIAADLAVVIARGYVAKGCTIDGCTDEVREAIKAPTPEHQEFRDAFHELKAEGVGIRR